MTTKDFLQVLFAGCTGFLELRHIPQGGDVSQQFRPLGDELSWLDKWGAGGRVDMYFGVYPRTRSAGTADAVAPEVSWLFSDLDGSDMPMPQALAPTIIVESGTAGHFHCYWHLTQPIAVAGAERANKALARALGGDLNATDRARVLRLPGTINSKTGREAVVTHYDPGATYGPEDFSSVVSVKTLTDSDRDADGASSAGHTPLSESMPAGVARVLLPSKRNTTLARFAGSMRRAGMERGEILAALREINRARCQPPLDDQELAKIARSVSRYAPGSVPGSGSSPSSSLYSTGDDDDGQPPVELRALAKPGPRQWVVHGWVPAGDLTVLYGGGGLAKSLLAMLMGEVVARGQDLFRLSVRQGRVLYLDWELDREEQARRAYRVAAGLGYDFPAAGFFYRQMDLPLERAFPRMRAWVSEFDISLVIIDSYGLATLGDSTAAKDVVAVLRPLARSLGTTLFIDHIRNVQPGEKGDELNPFGSVYKFNIGRSMIRVVRVDGDAVSLSILLRQRKSNFAALSHPLGLRVMFEDERICFEQAPLSSPTFAEAAYPVPALEKVYQALVAAEEASSRALATATGLKVGTVRNKLTELHHQNKAVPTGKGTWKPVIPASSLSSPLYSDDDATDASNPAADRGAEEGTDG